MAKQIIAVDIDDVLAGTTEALRLSVNEATGLQLTEADYQVPAAYWGFYEHVWTRAGLHDHSHVQRFHEQMAINQDNIDPIDGSKQVLVELSRNYDLILVTSRELFMESETSVWVHKHFPNIFQEIILLGHVNTALQTKGEACIASGATILIDDNIAHCESATNLGVEAVLFGDYGWQHDFDGSIPHAKNWQEVKAYFDAKHAK